MAKRTFWLVTGAAIGAGSSLWAERRVRRTVHQAAARLQPDALVVEVGRTARQVAGGAGDRLRDAVSSGRGRWCSTNSSSRSRVGFSPSAVGFEACARPASTTGEGAL